MFESTRIYDLSRSTHHNSSISQQLPLEKIVIEIEIHCFLHNRTGTTKFVFGHIIFRIRFGDSFRFGDRRRRCRGCGSNGLGHCHFFSDGGRRRIDSIGSGGASRRHGSDWLRGSSCSSVVRIFFRT